MVAAFPFHAEYRVSDGLHPPREGATWCAICGEWTWREDLVAHHFAHYPDGRDKPPKVLK